MTVPKLVLIEPFALLDGICYSHEQKEGVLFQHFSSHFSTPAPREYSINWEEIRLHRRELSHLEEPFLEEEILGVVQDIASDKAPGQDDFIGSFLKTAWPIIKGDFMNAFQFFYQQHDQHFQHLNTAHMVLLPKKADARRVKDFRPISLTHTVAKLISTCLANRLELSSLVSRAQSAFTKRQSIQDNFIYAQNLIRSLHRQKKQGLFFKLDIAKAFKVCNGTSS
jgi:hypothetical protein